MAKIYSVTAGTNVLNSPTGQRSRGGVRFGADPVSVGTAEADGVQVVTDAQLAAILADPELESTEISAADAKKAVAPPVAEAPAKPARKTAKRAAKR